MTPRQARRERRAAERKTRKAEIKRSKADLLTSSDPRPLPEEVTAPAYATAAAAEDGFVSQNSASTDPGPGIVLDEWLESARRRNFPQGFPPPKPPQLEFVSYNPAAPSSRAAINRANAKLSTGPRSPQGKLASSRNSTKHGLASSQLLIPGEDSAAFETLIADLLNDHQPANKTEELLVRQMAQAYWLEQRAIRFQSSCFDENGVDAKSLALFLRYGATHNRAFYKALNNLQRLQKDRRKADQKAGRGFVSQPTVKSAPSSEFVRQNAASTDLEVRFVSQTDPAEPLEWSHTASEAA